ncbi:MAG: hypothetical protein R3298_06930 [Gammaproteobacteria bacterium]|nr:hypothetical protein [Gammaproteobacteria bacterium]
MRSIVPSPLLLTLLLVLLAGCAGLEEDRRNADFGLQTLSFENAMRWGNYKLAATYLKPGPLTEAADPGRHEGVQITEYKVRNTLRSPDENRVTLDLRISYLRQGEASVRTLDQVQTWEYDEENKRWWLMTPLPAFE